MYKRLWILVFALVLGAVPCGSDEIGARVLLPDGKPAVGAKVIARITHCNFGRDLRYSQEEVSTVTDAQGAFTLTTSEISLMAGPGRSIRPYLLIDAPGCALCFLPLVSYRKNAEKREITVQLRKDFTFQGIVLGPNQKPVADAKVAVQTWSTNGVESSVLNVEGQIVTPQLTAKSGKDGKFTLRGIAGAAPAPEGGNSLMFSSGTTIATAIIGGEKWKGQFHFSSTESHGKLLFPLKVEKAILRPAK